MEHKTIFFKTNNYDKSKLLLEVESLLYYDNSLTLFFLTVHSSLKLHSFHGIGFCYPIQQQSTKKNELHLIEA